MKSSTLGAIVVLLFCPPASQAGTLDHTRLCLGLLVGAQVASEFQVARSRPPIQVGDDAWKLAAFFASPHFSPTDAPPISSNIREFPAVLAEGGAELQAALARVEAGGGSILWTEDWSDHPAIELNSYAAREPHLDLRIENLEMLGDYLIALDQMEARIKELPANLRSTPESLSVLISLQSTPLETFHIEQLRFLRWLKQYHLGEVPLGHSFKEVMRAVLRPYAESLWMAIEIHRSLSKGTHIPEREMLKDINRKQVSQIVAAFREQYLGLLDRFVPAVVADLDRPEMKDIRAQYRRYLVSYDDETDDEELPQRFLSAYLFKRFSEGLLATVVDELSELTDYKAGKSVFKLLQLRGAFSDSAEQGDSK